MDADRTARAQQARTLREDRHRERLLDLAQQRRVQRALKEVKAAPLIRPAGPEQGPTRPMPPRPMIRPDIHARFQAIVRRALDAEG